jgi:hypothetical protein
MELGYSIELFNKEAQVLPSEVCGKWMNSLVASILYINKDLHPSLYFSISVLPATAPAGY